MKYNLIHNGYFSASGDHSFTWSELDILQDGNTTTSGVTVSGVNDLVVDLSQRIKVDGIRLYASDLTKSSDIYFYYKNNEEDSYTQISTSVDSYYYTTVPLPSAPRYIKVTISGVSMDLYEFYVENDDYIVAFGEDGQQYAEYLEDTPLGSEGTVQAISIYNNSDYNMPANAYTCVEVVGSGYDDYIKISSSENGTYYKVTDGAIINTDIPSSNAFRWSDGDFSNTEVTSDKVEVSSGDSGTYMSPIFKLDNKYNSSYFFIDGTSDPDTGSISYDEDVYNGTIKVRSTDVDPIPLIEIYSTDTHYLGGGDYAIRYWIYTPFTDSLSYSSYIGSVYGGNYGVGIS